MLCWNERELDEPFHELVPGKVTVHFYMLRSLVKNRILSNVYCSHVITFDRYRGNMVEAKLIEQPAEPRQFSN